MRCAALSNPEIQTRSQSLRRDRVPFVHARVVRAEKPTSAKPGDEAIVLPGGSIEGFVGGSCAEATVRAQALALLDLGGTRMLRITPDNETERPASPDTVVAHNPCLSGGALEVFLEAVVPPPLLVVHGDGPVARALCALGKPLGHDVVDRADTSTLAEASAVVVASHGRDEEVALAAALNAGVPYIGLVASRRRGAGVLDSLGVAEPDRSRVHTPAGLDIGAVSPEEVALSIYAQIIAVRPAPPRLVRDPVLAKDATATAVDPVCGMDVATVHGSLHLDLAGTRYWFCGSGCLRAFSADPVVYANQGSS